MHLASVRCLTAASWISAVRTMWVSFTRRQTQFALSPSTVQSVDALQRACHPLHTTSPCGKFLEWWLLLAVFASICATGCGALWAWALTKLRLPIAKNARVPSTILPTFFIFPPFSLNYWCLEAGNQSKASCANLAHRQPARSTKQRGSRFSGDVRPIVSGATCLLRNWRASIRLVFATVLSNHRCIGLSAKPTTSPA